MSTKRVGMAPNDGSRDDTVALLRFIMKHPIFSAFIALSVGGMVALGLLLTFWEDIKMLLSDQFYFSLILAVALLGGIQTAVDRKSVV